MNAAESFPAPLARELARQAQGFGLPGLAVALVGPQGRRAVFTCGEDAPGSGRAVTPQTWFSVASSGKHVTAMAVLELAQAGRIDLDLPIGHYLADLPAAWADRSVASLLGHTSGLPEYLSHTPADAVPTRRADFMRAYAHLAPAFDEGQGWIYTNTNYILLGFLIAQAAGTSYAQALQALFARAGCSGVTVGSPVWARQANATGAGPDAQDADTARREVIGDGDLVLSGNGALGWLQALLGPALLQPAWRQRLWAPTTLATGRPSPYGCGWFVDSLRGQPLAYHGGHFDGWTAMASLAPAQGCGVFAMANLAPGHTRAVRQIAQTALEAWQPASTPLSLTPLDDDDPELTAIARTQLLREHDTLDLGHFADELKRVAAHGDTVRRVINLWTGVAPERFELVEQQQHATHRLRRYRLSYVDRTEHLLVGTTPERRIYWAWPL